MKDAGIMATSADDRRRLVEAVHFTEEYKDRLKGLIGVQEPPVNANKVTPAVRAFLAEDCWGGSDALAYPVYRTQTSYGHWVQVVGNNGLSPENRFKLRLIGYNAETDDPLTQGTDLGLTDYIYQESGILDVVAAFARLGAQFDINSVSVSFGNPFSVPQLVNTRSVRLGTWYIVLDAACYRPFAYYAMRAEYTASDIRGLTEISCQPSFDAPGEDYFVVTDIDYRTQQYAWQAGTIVTCLDFADIGYGIIRSTTRNMDVTLSGI